MEFKNTALAEHTKTLLLDIETEPHLSYFWGTLWKPSLSVDMVLNHGRMLSFASQWYGKKRVTFRSPYHHSREEMVQTIWDQVNEADIVIHFNGDKFDMKHLNREFWEEGLGPTSSVQSVDLLKAVTRNFHGFPTNKLAYITRVMESQGKLPPGGFATWKGCMENDPAKWAIMKKYNMRDTTELAEVYDNLLPWIPNHPNMALYINPETEEPTCPHCGTTNVHRRGNRYTSTGMYTRYHCQEPVCGKWSSSRIRKIKTGSGVLK